MRIRTLCLALALVGLAGAARADDASHTAAVKKFFAVAKMNDLINTTLEQMTDAQVRGNPAMAPYRDTLLGFFRKYMSWESLEPEITKIYLKEFTEAEMVEITTFYETPTGRKVMTKLPELSARGAAIGQARVQDNIQELQDMIAAEQAKHARAAKDDAPGKDKNATDAPAM